MQLLAGGSSPAFRAQGTQPGSLGPEETERQRLNRQPRLPLRGFQHHTCGGQTAGPLSPAHTRPCQHLRMDRDTHKPAEQERRPGKQRERRRAFTGRVRVGDTASSGRGRGGWLQEERISLQGSEAVAGRRKAHWKSWDRGPTGTHRQPNRRVSGEKSTSHAAPSVQRSPSRQVWKPHKTPENAGVALEK